MLHVSDVLIICSLLLLFILLVALTEGCVPVTLHEGTKHPYVKNARFRSLPQKSSAAMSNRAPSSLFADLRMSCSPERGWSGGSIPTLWHTSVRNPAVMSLSSLWRIDGNPPREQISACSIV